MIDLDNKRVLVVGLGKSGLAAVRLLRSRGARVIGNDLRDDGALRSELAALGAEAALGGHDEALFTSVDRIVVSPGVPPLAALSKAEAAGVPIASEIELASWFLESTVVGITGTNGKSTVTSLVGAMAIAGGRPTFVGGNLGTPLVDVVGTDAAKKGGVVVVELSSFQLERVDRFVADVAVLLNVTDDHLDRYESFAAYAAAKGRIFHHQRRSHHAVIPSRDALVESLARAGAAELHRFGPDGEVRVEGARFTDEISGLHVPVADFQLRGGHNLENACASMLAARLAGVDPGSIASALRSFRGLPHRMVLVRTLSNVTFYDDSKATNVGAAVAALDGLDSRVVLIAGGKDKGGSYGPLVDRMKQKGRAVVLIGEAAPLIEKAFEGSGLPIARERSLESATGRAFELAEAGDVVLLAPACSSFDMFRSYAERGDVFQRAVAELEERSASERKGDRAR
jgi:UDP-N-acetylmuramoylalanine--D-glutamate ligase